MGDLRNHAGTNVLIEVCTDIAQWLLGIFITWLILTIAGIPLSGGVISIIATILSIIASIIVTSVNDNKLINAIKEQQEVTLSIDKEEILKRLNQDTIHFYEKVR